MFVQIVDDGVDFGEREMIWVDGEDVVVVYVVDVCLYDFQGDFGLVVVVYNFGNYECILVVIFRLELVSEF